VADAEATARPRKEGASGVHPEVESKEPKGLPDTADTSDRSTPAGGVSGETSRSHGLRQGHGDFATLRLTEERHKIIRLALQVYAQEVRQTKNAFICQEILEDMVEGL
jgi:hypothetical protein